MKNEKFTLKAFFILKINELFNFNAHIAQYLEK